MSERLDWSIIKHFSGLSRNSFTFRDLTAAFPDRNRVYLSRVLSAMVQKGMLIHLARNIYHIVPLHADPGNYVPGGTQLARSLMQGEPYYIGYLSALRLNGLALSLEGTGNEEEVYVVSTRQMKPAQRTFGARKVHFVMHSSTRFFGFESKWMNDQEEVLVSDLEKTLVDIATKPQYGGGILNLARALQQSEPNVDRDKLFRYFTKNGNKSAKKRFLFLTDLLELEWTEAHSKMRDEVGSGISSLDPGEADTGKIRSAYGLKINVDPQFIAAKVQG